MQELSHLHQNVLFSIFHFINFLLIEGDLDGLSGVPPLQAPRIAADETAVNELNNIFLLLFFIIILYS